MSKGGPRVRVAIRPMLTPTDLKVFSGRYLGLIDEDECSFLVNNYEIARKAFTSESFKLGYHQNAAGKRALFASTAYTQEHSKILFLTPPIRYLYCSGGVLTIMCEDDRMYKAEEAGA